MQVIIIFLFFAAQAYILFLTAILAAGDGYVSSEMSKKILNGRFTAYKSPDSGGIFILGEGEHIYIGRDWFKPFAKYELVFHGSVPRWSKLHKRIKQFHKEAKDYDQISNHYFNSNRY